MVHIHLLDYTLLAQIRVIAKPLVMIHPNTHSTLVWKARIITHWQPDFYTLGLVTPYIILMQKPLNLVVRKDGMLILVHMKLMLLLTRPIFRHCLKLNGNLHMIWCIIVHLTSEAFLRSERLHPTLIVISSTSEMICPFLVPEGMKCYNYMILPIIYGISITIRGSIFSYPISA